MGKRIAGTCYFKRAGVQYSLKGSFNISPLDRQKEAVVGLDGVHGFKESPKAPYIEGQISDGQDLSVKAFQSVTDDTITAELANGKAYVLRNAWHAGESVIDGGEGHLTIRFEGLECKEILG